MRMEAFDSIFLLMWLQTREAAQAAKDELNGILLRDNELRIGWGKAVTIPPAALAVSALPAGLAALAAAKGASVPPPGMATALPWATQPQEPEKKPHDGNGMILPHNPRAMPLPLNHHAAFHVCAIHQPVKSLKGPTLPILICLVLSDEY